MLPAHTRSTAAAELIDEVVTAAARLGLPEIHQFMLVLRAVLAGHRGDPEAMADAQRALTELGGDQTQHTPRLHGLGATLCALLQEDPDQAREYMATALRAELDNPTTFHLTGRHGLWLLLEALDGTLTRAEYSGVTAEPVAGLRWDRHFALLAAAVLAARRGDVEHAMACVAASQRTGRLYPLGRHLGLRIIVRPPPATAGASRSDGCVRRSSTSTTPGCLRWRARAARYCGRQVSG